MTTFQKAIKYISLGFAICLSVFIFSTIAQVILGVISGITGIGEDKITESYTFNDINSLDIDFGAGDLKIKSSGDEFKVNVNEMYGFEYKIDNGTLKIDAGTGSFFDSDDAYVEIIVPEDFTLENLKIEIGAGKAALTDLNIDYMDAEVGAGKLNGDGLYVKDTSIEVGAGKATLEYVGPVSDYSIMLDKGIGSASVNGEDYSESAHKNSSAENRIDAEVGVGKISLNFK